MKIQKKAYYVVMPRFLSAFGGLIIDLTETLVIGFSLFLVVYLFFMQPHQVNGHSMDPNFQTGEYVLTDKISYRFRKPIRGEVIVFHAPSSAHCQEGTGCDFIKRIIGLPGEQIEVKNNGIYVNNVKLDEAYIPPGFETTAGQYTRDKVIVLNSDEYFVSGDNRPYSSDSRAWGPITFDEIVGRAFFIYWPPSAMGGIEEVTYPTK